LIKKLITLIIMKIYKLAHNTVDNKDYDILINFLKKRKYLNQSKITKLFEQKFSNFLGVKNSVFVNSGSSANLLIAQTLVEGNYLKNKVAILPAVSWSTTASPYLQLGYKVILCDCDKENLGISITHLEQICKKYNPGLLVLVNVLGHSNDSEKILHLKKKYKFQIIEDNCESLGSSFNSKKLGTLGLASSHSFYFGHHISTIEGGMVSTNDKRFYNISLGVRAHGWARDMQKTFRKKLEKKYNVNEFEALYTFYYSGFNFRSTDLNATLGIQQLKKISRISKIRHKNFYYYKEKLSDYWWQNSKLNLLSSFGYATFVKNRLEVYKYLKSKKIQCRPLICGNIAQQPFWKKNFFKQKKLANASFVHRYGLYLPNHANLNRLDIDYISKCFKHLAKPIFF